MPRRVSAIPWQVKREMVRKCLILLVFGVLEQTFFRVEALNDRSELWRRANRQGHVQTSDGWLMN